jgi:hypothetical protein
MDISHRVFVGGKIIKTFADSAWYDTATPFQFCTNELRQLKSEIQRGQRLTIESTGKNFEIETLDDFRSWLVNIFGGGFEEYVFK